MLRGGVVHHVFGLQITVHDAYVVRSLHRTADLRQDSGNFLRRKRTRIFRKLVEDFPPSPFDGEVIALAVGLSVV